MKTMSCKQLGGACDKEFQASSFEEIIEMSKQHGMDMFLKQDEDHLESINKIRGLMQKPKEMQKWIDDKRKEFEALPEDE